MNNLKPYDREIDDEKFDIQSHIKQAQEEIRSKGMCGAVYDGKDGNEYICIKDPHLGQHCDK